MPRIRTIKPDFWSDEKVMNVSRDARLLFIGMWNFADDNGVLPYSVKEIKARIFPGDEDTDVAAWITELIEAELVCEYDADGKNYLFCPGLCKHQYIDSPRKSNLPPPPSEKIIGNHKKSSEIIGNHRKSCLEGKGRERKRKGKEGKVLPPPPKGNGGPPPAFESECFAVSVQYLEQLAKDFPQFPAAYLLTDFFPRMASWCLDNRDKAAHRKKFQEGRLKNPHRCLLAWLRREDPVRAEAYRPRPREQPGQAAERWFPNPKCDRCQGSGVAGDAPCTCLKPGG